MQKGTIVKINPNGFGFIKTEGATKDVFFHANELVNSRIDDLREGDEVEFDIEESPKGPNAVRVNKI
ncbi:MAG TPA: cold shock domain-containing protein [Candidatus Paceibacterota bacterium]|jgi:CspA family cold shock protein